MPRSTLLAVLSATLTACASGTPSMAPAPAPTPASVAPAAPTSSAAPMPTPAPAPAKALDPVGTFAATTEVNGNPIAGKLYITSTNGRLGGRFVSDAFPEMPVSKVVVQGQTMTVDLETPNGTATVALTFNGNEFTGQWELGGQGGAMKGRRLP